MGPGAAFQPQLQDLVAKPISFPATNAHLLDITRTPQPAVRARCA
jgi:hypothetical protein